MGLLPVLLLVAAVVLELTALTGAAGGDAEKRPRMSSSTLESTLPR